MEKEVFIKEITNMAQSVNEELSLQQCEKFYDYMNLLLKWNEKINLTAITDPKEIIIKHFIDSIIIKKHIKENSKLVDIGTGAGFPGIPLKIADDTIKVTLVDSLNKRIKFLADVINKLELKNIDAIHARAEEIGQNKKYREQYDIVTSRAVAKLNILAEYMMPLVKTGGQCICMKGPEVEEEIESSKNAIHILGGEIQKIESFVIPNTDIKRTIIIINKITQTPSKYPRKAGTPSKTPLN